ncbi:hypothetical protein [Bacillus altitudinis]|uniref:hypothetical protein n=1 Tax=Bacillus TaxID=1386 RepID=UPI002B307164|nr:hypothetical protein R0126_08560 [Bacillus stratosphericus]
MKSPKITFIEDLKGYLKNLTVVLVTVLLLSNNISISEGILKITPGRLSWFLDIGIYTFITLLIISLLKLFYSQRLFKIECYFYFDKEYKNNEINLIPNKSEKIYLFISVRGDVKFLPTSIKISYSESLSLQTKSHPAILVDDENNTYTINLEKLFAQQDYIEEDNEISFDLIADDQIKRKVIKPQINKNEKTGIYRLKKEVKSFTINKKESTN